MKVISQKHASIFQLLKYVGFKVRFHMSVLNNFFLNM